MLALLTALVLAPAFAQDEGAEDAAEEVDVEAARAAPASDEATPAAEAAPTDAEAAPTDAEAAPPAGPTAPEDETGAETETETESGAETETETETDAPASVVITGAREAPTAEEEPAELEVEGPPQLSATPHGVGLGVILGAPTGLSGAWRPEDSRSTAVVGLAWNFTERKLHVHGDYLFTVYDMRVPEAPTVGFPIYVGLGGRVRAGGTDGFDLGVRIPVGVNIMPDDLPIDGFLELVPVVGLFPDTELAFEGGLGARVYFF